MQSVRQLAKGIRPIEISQAATELDLLAGLSFVRLLDFLLRLPRCMLQNEPGLDCSRPVESTNQTSRKHQDLKSVVESQ